MDWNKGFSASYELRKVDPVSWMDAGPLDLVSGSVSRSDGDLQESASLQMKENPQECWIRIYLKARQSGSGARVPIFTGLTSTPSRDVDGNRIDYPVTCYSVLKPAKDVLPQPGYYVPAGAEGARVAAQLLSVGAAPVSFVDDGPKMMEAIVAEDSDTNLSLAQAIVESIGWRIRISGDGSISIEPRAVEQAVELGTLGLDAVETKIKDTQDWYSVPNCFRAATGSLYAVARDDDPDSPMSTANRRKVRGGTGEVWASEAGVTLGSMESLSAYALRRLKELQAPARTLSYTRRFFPEVTIGDLIGLHYPAQQVDGIFRISRQTITLEYGAKTQEEVTYERY